jgi:hypothetical protein
MMKPFMNFLLTEPALVSSLAATNTIKTTNNPLAMYLIACDGDILYSELESLSKEAIKNLRVESLMTIFEILILLLTVLTIELK